ncbi:MAG: hypothetical protein WCH98_19295, partial [Verrucomicrobiota bacterium]
NPGLVESAPSGQKMAKPQGDASSSRNFWETTKRFPPSFVDALNPKTAVLVEELLKEFLNRRFRAEICPASHQLSLHVRSSTR